MMAFRVKITMALPLPEMDNEPKETHFGGHPAMSLAQVPTELVSRLVRGQRMSKRLRRIREMRRQLEGTHF
jgi:hypothetical protein